MNMSRSYAWRHGQGVPLRTQRSLQNAQRVQGPVLTDPRAFETAALTTEAGTP
jgi:ribosomal protein S13